MAIKNRRRTGWEGTMHRILQQFPKNSEEEQFLCICIDLEQLWENYNGSLSSVKGSYMGCLLHLFKALFPNTGRTARLFDVQVQTPMDMWDCQRSNFLFDWVNKVKGGKV